MKGFKECICPTQHSSVNADAIRLKIGGAEGKPKAETDETGVR